MSSAKDKEVQTQFRDWCRRNRQAGNLGPLIALLQLRLDEDKDRLVTQDMTLVPRLQGSARELTQLLELITKE